jgi:hypothetical protein
MKQHSGCQCGFALIPVECGMSRAAQCVNFTRKGKNSRRADPKAELGNPDSKTFNAKTPRCEGAKVSKIRGVAASQSELFVKYVDLL